MYLQLMVLMSRKKQKCATCGKPKVLGDCLYIVKPLPHCRECCKGERYCVGIQWKAGGWRLQ